MPDVRSIFWRAVTPADFFNVERSRAAAPNSGGGQSYFSISFAGLSHDELGRFLGVNPPSRIATDRPTVPLPEVGVVGERDVVDAVEFASRYRPPNEDDRYRIVRQNRQYQHRHPAWSPSRGFPKAPDDVRRGDPLPDLTYLKIYILKLDDDSFLAGFVNTPTPPSGLAVGTELGILFEPADRATSAGVIEFGPGDLSLDTWTTAFTPPRAGQSVEIAEAIESTRVAAGKRPRGQGFRVNVEARRATELQAMSVATELLEADGWTVEDVSATRSYDLDCRRGDANLHVEVKGTTSAGDSVLLTPGEVAHAREHHPHVALIVVAGIIVEQDPHAPGIVVGTGGSPTVVNPWEIDEQGDLVPTGYEYRRQAD